MFSPSSVTAMYFPSGDQSAVWKNVGWSNLISRGALRPSCVPIIRRYSPLASENQATCFPSGDQTGVRSAVPELRVKLRASPFSAGTEKTSPRAENSARAPLGDSDADSIHFDASTQLAITCRGDLPWAR